MFKAGDFEEVTTGWAKTDLTWNQRLGSDFLIYAIKTMEHLDLTLHDSTFINVPGILKTTTYKITLSNIYIKSSESNRLFDFTRNMGITIIFVFIDCSSNANNPLA